MYILVIFAYILIGIIEIIPLFKKKKKKELLLYLFFFLTAFIISLLLSMGVKIPSPSSQLEKMLE